MPFPDSLSAIPPSFRDEAGKPEVWIIPRPRERGQRLAEWVQENGGHPVLSPVLEMQPLSRIFPKGWEAVVVASAHAIPALGDFPRDLPVFAVGQATAQAARVAGFSKVQAAGGSAELLARMVREQGWLSRSLLLAAGVSASGCWYGEKLAQETGAARLPAYRVHYAKSLSPEALEVLQTSQCHGIFFFSTETVRAFSILCPIELRPALAGMTALCLSQAIARETGRIFGREVWGGIKSPEWLHKWVLKDQP